MIIVLSGNGIKVQAAPAPKLTSVKITDVTVDENNKVYIEVTEMGTSKNRLVYCNNELLKENIYETVPFDVNGDRIIDGYRRYYYTGYMLSDIYSGLKFRVTAKYTNAMSPWNTLTATQIFTFQ